MRRAVFGKQVRHTNGKKKTRQGQSHRKNIMLKNIEDKVNNG